MPSHQAKRYRVSDLLRAKFPLKSVGQKVLKMDFEVFASNALSPNKNYFSGVLKQSTKLTTKILMY